MSVLRALCMTLVASFCSASLSPAPAPAYNDQVGVPPSTFEKGHGPQISITPEFPTEHAYYWDSEIPIQKGPVVVFANDARPFYNITQDPNAKRGFIIQNGTQTLLVATDKKKALCGFGYTFHTGYNVSYRARSGSHRWTMTVVGQDSTETKLTYRFHKHNRGDVKFAENGTVAASFTYQSSNSTPGRMTLTTMADSTKVEPAKLVGLWILAQKRKKRCWP